MKRKVPEITESVEDLKRLLRQAKKKHEVQRLNVVYLMKTISSGHALSGSMKNETRFP